MPLDLCDACDPCSINAAANSEETWRKAVLQALCLIYDTLLNPPAELQNRPNNAVEEPASESIKP